MRTCGGGRFANGHAESLASLSKQQDIEGYTTRSSYRWEGLDRLLLKVIPVEIKLRIVYSESTDGAIRTSEQGKNWSHRHTVVRTVGGVLEVSGILKVRWRRLRAAWRGINSNSFYPICAQEEASSTIQVAKLRIKLESGGYSQLSNPVIRKVLGHLAGSAGCPGGDIAGHCGVEGISTDDVVNVGGRELAGLSSGVKTLSGQGRAWESKSGSDDGNKGEERRHLHLGGRLQPSCTGVEQRRGDFERADQQGNVGMGATLCISIL